MWQQVQGLIEANQEFMPDHFILTCHAPEVALLGKPGQFVHLQVSNETDPLLRRPISIFHADSKAGMIALAYRVAGRGTSLLAKKQKGQLLNLLGPLGNGFMLPEDERASVLVIGGGIGLAPLQYLLKQLTGLGHQATFVAGLRNKEQLPLLELFPQQEIELMVTTDDGSYGQEGFVTHVSQRLFQERKFSQVYACGPDGMLKKVATQAREADVACQVSLERTMACGVGACLGCTCETIKEGNLTYSHVCKDGPVFWGNEVLFNG